MGISCMSRARVSFVATVLIAACSNSQSGDTAFGDDGGDVSTGTTATSTNGGTSTSSGTGTGTGQTGSDATSSTTSGASSGDGSSSGATLEDASGTTSPVEDASGSSGEDAASSSSEEDSGPAPDPLWVSPNLWYAVEDKLHYIELDPSDGTVVRLVTSTMTTPLIDGQNGLTMLDDGSLLGSREQAGETQLYHIPEPPTEPSSIEVTILGTMPDGLRIEGVYTDCWGRVYLMDTGADTTSADGNRLILLIGDYLAGDLSYEVITDLANASVADIDDMSPGIDDDGEITDGQGFAIDTGTVHDFDFTTGTGTSMGTGGTFGIHALGGPLFNDGVARLYLLDREAELYEADPQDLTLSPVLVTGPTPEGDADPGWSSLAGPLTECETSFPVPQ